MRAPRYGFVSSSRLAHSDMRDASTAYTLRAPACGTHACAHSNARPRACTHTLTRAHSCTRARACTHTRTHAHSCTHMHAHKHVHSHAHARARARTPRLCTPCARARAVPQGAVPLCDGVRLVAGTLRQGGRLRHGLSGPQRTGTEYTGHTRVPLCVYSRELRRVPCNCPYEYAASTHTYRCEPVEWARQDTPSTIAIGTKPGLLAKAFKRSGSVQAEGRGQRAEAHGFVPAGDFG
jgi:hypothetical protein